MKIVIGKLLKKVFKFIGIDLYYKSEYQLLCNIKNAYESLLIQKQLKKSVYVVHPKCFAIVFSKDRAIQLHALLASYLDMVMNPVPLTILYTTTNQRHQKAYEELITLFEEKNFHFIKEKNFKSDLLNVLKATPCDKVFFMTDDAVFIDKFDLNEAVSFDPSGYIFTLNKGLDHTWCYTYNCEQELPEFILNQINHIKFGTGVNLRILRNGLIPYRLMVIFMI
ncbi:MAG: hypothetical protein HC905_31035 [Bacteroidales bacterium]|nr:hypothetical protein [Bacteroidales bacterium]